MAEDKTPMMFASFRADILPVLQPFVAHAREDEDFRFFSGEVFCEPCAEGGVMVGAVSPHAMAVIRDPDGAASHAMTLGIPDAAFEAATDPAPLRMSFCGDSYSVPLPDWARPGSVWVHSAGIHVVPRMRHPAWAEEDQEFQPTLFSMTACGQHYRVGVDFNCSSGTPASWRKPLETACAAGVRHDASFRAFSPRIAGLFGPALERAMERAGPASDGTFPGAPCFMFCKPDDDGRPAPVVVTFGGDPDFIGTFMPLTDAKATLPEWWRKTVEPMPTTERQ